MTSPFQPGQTPGVTPGAPTSPARGPAALPTPPKGWPIGSYPTYAEAQRAVDHLSDQQFPVQQVTIVGVDLMQVERVTGRLTWPKVLGGGVLTGAWLGLFIGLILGFFSENPWAVADHRPGRGRLLRSDHLGDPVRDGSWHKGFQLDDATCRRPLRRAVRPAERREGPGSAGALDHLASKTRALPQVTIVLRPPTRRWKCCKSRAPGSTVLARAIPRGQEAGGARTSTVCSGIGGRNDGIRGDGV